MNFETIKHYSTGLSSAMTSEVTVRALYDLFKRVPHADIRKARFKMTGGLSTLDEQVYDQAERRLEPILRGRLRKRLATTLSAKMQNYFRVIILGNLDPMDKDEIALAIDRMEESLHDHANEPDKDWENYIKIMDLNQTEEDPRIQKLATKAKAIIEGGKKTLRKATRKAIRATVKSAKKADKKTDRWARTADQWMGNHQLLQSARRISHQRQNRNWLVRLLGI